VKGGDWLGRIRAALMTLTAGRHGGIQTGTTRIAPSRCAVTLLGTMTRAELEARMSLMLVKDGFLGRMVLIPIGPRRTYLSRPPAWTQEDLDRRDRLVAWVRSIAGSQDCWGEAFMHHDKAALALRDTGDDPGVSGRRMAWWGLGLGIAGLIIGLALIAYRFA